MSTVNLHQVKPEPNENVVELLEEALEMAKRGELQSLAMVGSTDHKTVYFDCAANCNLLELVGALSLAHSDIIETLGERGRQ